MIPLSCTQANYAKSFPKRECKSLGNVHSRFYIACDYLCATAAEANSSGRGCSEKPKLLLIWVFTQKICW